LSGCTEPVGESNDARYFSLTPSYTLVFTKANLGNIEQNKITGAAIAAIFEFEKKDDRKIANIISDKQKRKKNAKTITLLLRGRNDEEARKLAVIAIHRNTKKPFITHDSWYTQSFTPAIVSNS
jgi:hypothetical protein